MRGTLGPSRDRSSSPRRWRALRWLLAVAVPAAIAVGCEGWDGWDTPFRRRYFGWFTGDGGNTIKIGNRMLWVMGDSFQHIDGDLYSRYWGGIFGNTIALHPLSSPPTAPPFSDDFWPPNNTISFYARATNTRTDITWGPADNPRAFFGKTCTDFTDDVFSWPSGGIYQTADSGGCGSIDVGS